MRVAPGVSFREWGLTAPGAAGNQLGRRALDRLAPPRQRGVGHEVALRVERLLVLAHGLAARRAVGTDDVGLHVVGHVGEHDLPQHLRVHGGVLQRHDHLDAPVEVARHEVGRADPDDRVLARQRLAVAEAVDAAVLEEAPDDRLHADALAEAGHARPQAAYAAHDQLAFDARARCGVERIDDGGIDEGVHLHPHRRGPPSLRVRDLAADARQDRVAHVARADGQHLGVGPLAVAGDEVEHARHVARDAPVAGEVAQIGVDARGNLVIIARAQMAVGAQAAFLAPHDQAHLGMGLELHEAEHDLHARALQLRRPANVGRLVEARLELDQGGDGLAGLRRVDQRLHDRAVVRRAVERLLDRQHVGVRGRLVEEVDHHLERFVGVVDDEVLLAHGGEHVARLLAHALGKARHVAIEEQVVAVELHDARQRVERQRARHDGRARLRHAQLLDHELAQGVGKIGVELDAHHRAAAAALERGLEEAEQVLGLLLQLDVRIAHDAERARPRQIVAGKQAVHEGAAQILQRDQADRAILRGQPPEAVERGGQAQQRAHRLAVAAVGELQSQREA